MARPDPQPTELEALNIHISGLLATDKRLSEEELDLDKLGAVPVEPKAGDFVASKTRHFMNGFNFLPSLGLTKGERLFVVRQDREGIRLALSELEQQRQRLLSVEAAAAAKANTPRWLELLRRDAWLADQIKAVEAAIGAMRFEFGGELLPHNHIFGIRSILGVRWSADPAGEARRELLKHGVLSAADLKDAANVK